MDIKDFEKERVEEKCVDFKSNVIATNLADCFIVEENRFGDDRGYFTSITSKQLDALDFKRWSQKSESKSEHLSSARTHKTKSAKYTRS